MMRRDVIEAPTDVALAHVAPGRPPREQPVVVGVDVPTDIDEAMREQAIDHVALDSRLSNHVLAQNRVHVDLRARNIEVAAEHEVLAGFLERSSPRFEL